MAFKFFILALAIPTITLFCPVSVSGQINPIPNPNPNPTPTPTPSCTPSMITTFTPCVNFTTNGNVNGTAPSSDCCNSLKSLMSNGKDCLCLIATGSVPFQIPINRTLAISLPRACNMPGVPLQCKAAGAPSSAPAPAPGPEANGPSVSPSAAPSPSATGVSPPEALSPRSSPGTNPTSTPTPAAPTTNGASPGSNTGSRAGVSPSAAPPSYGFSPLLLMAVLGAVALKLC